MTADKKIILITLILSTVVISGCSPSYETSNYKTSNEITSSENQISMNEAIPEKKTFEEGDNKFEYEELDNGFVYTDNANYFGYAFDANEFMDRFITSKDDIVKIENDLGISMPLAEEVNFENDYIFILWNSAITDICKIRYISNIGIMKEKDEETDKEKEVYSIIYKDGEETKYIDETKGAFLISYNVIKISKENLPSKEMNFKIVQEAD